jgi:hypothetical protein
MVTLVMPVQFSNAPVFIDVTGLPAWVAGITIAPLLAVPDLTVYSVLLLISENASPAVPAPPPLLVAVPLEAAVFSLAAAPPPLSVPPPLAAASTPLPSSVPSSFAATVFALLHAANENTSSTASAIIPTILVLFFILKTPFWF